MNFGKRIKELRLKAGLTQKELADKLDITDASVGMWENNRAKPRLDKLNQLCELLDVPMFELLGENYTNIIGTSALVPVLGWSHMGQAVDIDECDFDLEIPAEVALAHPKAFAVHAEGECMNRRYPNDCFVLVDPDMEPVNGCAVLARIGEQSVIRVYNKGANVLLLSPDSTDESFEDTVIRPDDEGYIYEGRVCWYQKDKDDR